MSMDKQESMKFIRRLCSGMSTSARRTSTRTTRNRSSSSVMKEKYGDTWTFFDGIRSGYDHVMGQRSFPQQWDESEEVTEYSMDAWEEHYDEYGYGSYGRGLEIGKALAIRTDKEFTFIGDSEDDESKFTFIE